MSLDQLIEQAVRIRAVSASRGFGGIGRGRASVYAIVFISDSRGGRAVAVGDGRGGFDRARRRRRG